MRNGREIKYEKEVNDQEKLVNKMKEQDLEEVEKRRKEDGEKHWKGGCEEWQGGKILKRSELIKIN